MPKALFTRYLSIANRSVRLLNPWLAIVMVPALVMVACWALSREHVQQNLGNNLAEVLANVSFSMIAAFVFYLALDVTQRARTVRNLRPYVSQRIQRMKGDLDAIGIEVARAAQRARTQTVFDPSDFEIDSAALSFATPAALVFPDGQRGTMLDYLLDRSSRTEQQLNHMLAISPFLGPDGVALIAKLQDDSFLSQMRMLRSLRGNVRGSIGTLAKPLSDHHALLAQLESWARRSALWD